MFDILTYIPSKRKQSSSGWISFNGPCCIHNGENADKRQRGGLMMNDDGWSYHCFNCGYKTSFTLGRNLSYKARKLMQWLHVPDIEIDRLNLESLRHKSVEGLIQDRKEKVVELKFDTVELPEETTLLTPEYTKEWEYIQSRNLPEYPFLVYNAEVKRPRKGIIIPFTHGGKIVGHTTRFLDDRKPKYLNHMPPGYVFGADIVKDDWEFVIVCEGVFDAISISGLAVLHNDINEQQATLLRQLGKTIIVVPDFDEPGLKLVDSAIKHGFEISIPPWGDDVKDINDAVKKYGRVTTVLAILENRVHGKIKSRLTKKTLERKVKS